MKFKITIIESGVIEIDPKDYAEEGEEAPEGEALIEMVRESVADDPTAYDLESVEVEVEPVK